MIKQFFKKVLISYLIIICCIYTPTAQAANWSFGGYNFGNGSLNIVKDGVKITTAPVNTAPITSSLGAKILGGALRGASVLNAISIVAGLGSDAIDWVLDPANNAVNYKAKNPTTYYVQEATGSTALGACKKYALIIDNKSTSIKIASNGNCSFYSPLNGSTLQFAVTAAPAPSGSVPVPVVADKIYNNAKSGDTTAQADVTAVVTELVNSGTYDTPINQAIQGTSNPTDPNTQIDTSSIIAAIQSLASSLASSIANAFNGITSVINTSIDKLLNKQEQMQGELVNVGSKVEGVGGQVVGVGDKVDSVGGKVVGVGDAVKDVGGKVVGLNDSVDKVGDKVVGVGDKVTTTGDKVTDAVTGVGDKVTTTGDKVTDAVTGVGDKVTTTGDKVTDAVTGVGDKVTTTGDKVADAVTGVGDKVTTTGDKVADAVKESTKEITKKMDETKPKDFELPAFCDWAKPVCDFIEWVKTPGEDMLDEPVDIQSPMPQMESTDITFGGQCPQNFDIDIDLFGKPVKFTLFDSNMFCQFLSDWIRIPVIFSASLVAVYILGVAVVIKLFAELLKNFNKGWLKQILTGAGLTLGTSAISLTALNSMITFFKSNIGQIPATTLGLAHIAGFDYAISIILGAIVASHVQSMSKLTLRKI